MSEHFLHFRCAHTASLVALDYNLNECLAQWDVLRRQMVRGVPPEFTRDEWAYLAAFLERDNLMGPFRQSFGERTEDADVNINSLFRPRGPIAIWLPNNASLLGPLVLILASFTRMPLYVKSGSRSDDLCEAFVSYAANHLPDGELRSYIRDCISHGRFGRADGRNKTMAAEAAVRIVFGSDATATAVHSLPHPVNSVGISFADHRSEAWVEAGVLDDRRLATLIRVFSIYGSAGCTSPRRVVLIDGDEAACRGLRERMLALWPATVNQDVPMHVASQNILLRQLAAASGADAQTCARNAAVLSVGSPRLPAVDGLMALALVPATADEAAATLPANIQTIGHCLQEPSSQRWLTLLARKPVKRWVPVGEMHHFNAVWDGMNFWRQLFEETFVSL